ncbi:nitrate reductase molybdenum cofactor assembly chaperone [Streptomyces beihaiensis]|uniref:Nitrate reductase molybdenum cofactor assembly chaperone n=1 Tax=Streptomyces beihaiensis TaxID=2984495 RepID=A0ABT3TSQ4_9ACTN|nr:nitrate reductase molybdenum cofactor assembly chaperone [Streptomyces beihaiensis]MCX3059536.1 nitrate reductase molybdenum cofactor assembly chaperone [Streptomyces beihaiensis]
MTPEARTRLAAGRLLTYPDETLYAQLPLIRDVVAGLATPEPAAFLARADRERPLDLAAHYTSVFDTRSRRCLYLTWWTDGDTRNRGLSLVRVKQTYRDHGWVPTEEELPDFLPVMLEFAAMEEQAGTALLQQHRAGLELLRIALAEHGTPYALLLRAVCATLPGPSPATRAEAKALARTGPPRESVGLAALDPLGARHPLEPLGPGVDLPWPVRRAATQERTSA